MPTIRERIEHYDLDGHLVRVEDVDVERPETVAEMMAAFDARIEQLHGRVHGGRRAVREGDGGYVRRWRRGDGAAGAWHAGYHGQGTPLGGTED